MALPLKPFRAIYGEDFRSQAFQEAWERVYAECPWANVFCSYDWVRASWEIFDNDNKKPLAVRFVDEKGETRAICMHRRSDIQRPWRKVRTCRSVDYNVHRMPPILARTTEDMAAAIFTVYEENKGKIDIFDLFKIDEMNGELFRLVALLEACGMAVHLGVFNLHPHIELPDDEKKLRSLRSKNTWKKLRNHANRARAKLGEIRFERFRPAPSVEAKAVDAVIDEIYEVYHESWQGREIKKDASRSLEELQRFYRRMAHALAKAGKLDITLLYTEDKLAAFDYNIIEEQTVKMMFGAYLPSLQSFGLGTQLLVESLKDSISRGDKMVDFGGEYLDYKRQWTKSMTPAYHLRIFGKTIYGRLRARLSGSPKPLVARGWERLLQNRFLKLPIVENLANYSRFHVYKLGPMEHIRDFDDSFHVRQINREELGLIAECRAMTDVTKGIVALEKRLDAGSICFGLFDGETIVGFCWANRGRNILEDEDRYTMRLCAKGAYLFDSFIRPDSRRKKLYLPFIKGIKSALAKMKSECVFFTVEATNEISMLASDKMGGEVVEMVTFFSFAGFDLHIVEMNDHFQFVVNSPRNREAVLADLNCKVCPYFQKEQIL